MVSIWKNVSDGIPPVDRQGEDAGNIFHFVFIIDYDMFICIRKYWIENGSIDNNNNNNDAGEKINNNNTNP